MERKIRKDTRVLWVLKALLAAYVITGILLLLLAMALYRLELNEKSVSAAVIAIYVLSTLVGGVVIGKLAKVRRFLWGLGLGSPFDYSGSISYAERRQHTSYDDFCALRRRRNGGSYDILRKMDCAIAGKMI